ncbi:MAG: hypothetical protein JXA24_03725 [Proteobacteria bacterium]|nr:hypothetical protein [Pseudomonadota bacterium]
MKRGAIAVLAVVAVIAVAAIATNGFAFGISVPKSVGDVADAPKDMAYDACKAWADAHQNNMTYNSGNIEKEMKGKEFGDLTYEKDWRKSDNRYDKENQRLELRTLYNQFAELKVRCNKEKCDSIYCNRK